MCGILGAINTTVDIETLLATQSHRGPNAQGSYGFANLLLGHNRLSIQDLSQNANQPFHYQEYSIIFNGEIYNHSELKEELREFSFKTSSDTETLLYLFIKYKEQMFHKIDGMFAFAILDKKNNTLFLARDRAGKKPLYFYKKENAFLFASELNTLKSSIKLTINEEAIASYLRIGTFFNTHTPYQDIYTAKAGTLYTLSLDTLSLKEYRYFDMLSCYKEQKRPLQESLTLLDELLHKSVKNRLLSSDLEVGAFLSGGIDSSLVVAIASQYKQKIKTFTVKFEGAYDESHLAKLTAQKYQTEHIELPICMNLKDDIEKILINYGEPFPDSSAIPSYYVSREAKKHISVVLNGDGADELFGGYRRYVGTNLTSLAKPLSFLTTLLPKAHSKKSLYNYLYRLFAMANKKGLDFYLSSTSDIFEDSYTFAQNSITDEMDTFIDNITLNPLSKMLYLDFSILLFSDLLVKIDIATMANSLEARSPFLSKYILEFAPTLPNNQKIRALSTKYILRELSKKYLPQEIIHQPKRGFEVPLKKWVENDLKENIFDALSSQSYSRNFVDRSFIHALLEKKVDVSAEKRAKMLWSMYALEVWKKSL